MTLPLGLGQLDAASPAMLWALAAVPLFFFLGRGARLAATCRTAAAVAVVLVLAGVSVERPRPATGACVVALVDVSGSVQRAAADRAAEFLGKMLPLLRGEDAVGAVAFAGRARVVARPESAPRTLAALLPPEDAVDLEPEETDLAAALATAAPLCPEGKQAALVLFSDGNETSGSAVAEVALGEPRVPVFPVVPAAAQLPAATLRRLLAPAFAPAHAVLPLEAVVESRAAGPRSLALAITVNGVPLTPVPAELPPGASVLRLPYRFEAAGNYVLEAMLLVPPGEPPAVGTVAAAIGVTGPVRVLVVSERERPVFAVALARRGMDVEVTAPDGLGARAARLDDYHLVVLDDVARAGVPDGVLDALGRRVAAGGGLVVTGGGHLFGDAGFVGTPLERLLPVALQSQRPEPKQREPIALYLLIDRSNSMGYASSQPALEYGEKMEYAKRAALAVLDQLGPRDLVGAIAFDSQPHQLTPLLPLAEGRGALAAKIRQLQYGGGTDFKEALETAGRALVEAGPRVRHIILLTDGDTNRRAEDHLDLIAQLARDATSVTTIRIGADTVNLDLLERISRATGGAFHHVEDVQTLPQLMISDTQQLMDAAADRRSLAARIGTAGAILGGIDEEDLPRVSRWAVTRAKRGAELRLWVEAGERRDPLLATWQYELGRVAALPLDFHAGAAAWPTWRGFAKLWSQLAMWAAPAGLASERRLEAHRLRDGTLVRLETRGDEPGPFVLRLEGGSELGLRPTARRRFEAVAPPLEPGVHEAVLVTGEREDDVDLVVPAAAGSGREQRASAPDLALLDRLAALTGGRRAPAPAELLDARAGVRRQRVPLEKFLIPLALALVLADVGLRRLAGGSPGAAADAGADLGAVGDRHDLQRGG